MKRILSFLGGVGVGAIVFGAALGFLGYQLGHGPPSVNVRNLTQSRIHVRIDTEAGESYDLNEIDPAGSRRTQVSGRETALWITATTSTGETYKSEHFYYPGGSTVFIVVTERSIAIDYDF